MNGGDRMNFIVIRNYLKENGFDFISYYDAIQGEYEIAVRTNKNNLKMFTFKDLHFSHSYISICDYDKFTESVVKNIITVGQFADVVVNRGGKSSPEK